MRHFCVLLLCFLSIQFVHANILVAHPHGAYLGVKSYQLEPEKAELLGFSNQFGDYLTYVFEGTPAHEIGLKAFDYVYGLGDHRADRSRDLSDLLSQFEPGDQTKIHIIRDGKPMSFEVTLSKPKNGSSASRSDHEDPHFGIWENDSEHREELGVVVSVSRYGLAQEMGLRSHDRVLMFNGYPIVDYKDLTTAINMTPIGEEFEVVYERKGKRLSSTAEMKSKAEHDRQVVEKKAQGRPFIGVNLEVINSAKAKELDFEYPHGSYVTSIIPNTAAEKGGLQPFDYIYGVNEEYVDKHRSLGDIMSYYQPDEKVKLHIVRKGKAMVVPLTFGRRSDAGERPDLGCDGPFFGVTYNDIASDRKGVGVNIVKGSSAEKLGLQKEDIILKINGYQIADFTDVTTAIEMLKAGEEIEVEYLRNEKNMTGSTPIGSECDRNNRDSWGSNWNNNDIEVAPDGTVLQGSAIDETFEQVDLENVRVGMEDLSQEEVDGLKQEYGIEFSRSNELSVDELNLFPDPNEGIFRLQFNLKDRNDTTIRIFNNMGRLIYNYELGDFNGSFDDAINMVQNGAGAYYLEIAQGSKSLTKKEMLANM